MQDLNDLFYFVNVVECGGFTSAGRHLGMPKSKLSRRIAGLEERLGVRLIQRTSRNFVVSEVGKKYYQHCKAMLVEAEAAQESIDELHSEPRGLIRLSCPTGLLNSHVGAMLADFMVLHPRITISLEATNRRVDVVGEGLDIAIRVRPPPLEDSTLVMRVLAERGQCLVASPELIKQKGHPATPSELADFPSLVIGQSVQTYAWSLFGPDDEHVVIHHTPRLMTTDMMALRKAAIAGVGIVQLPLLMVQKQITEGSLLRVLPDWQPRREIIHAVFPTRRGLLPSIRTLIDYLAQRFENIQNEQ